MGRASRRKQTAALGVTLEPADFHRLVSKARHVEVVRLEAREKAARLAGEIVQKEIAAVEAEKRVLFDALATKYGLDPQRTYRFDEASCRLMLEPT